MQNLGFSPCPLGFSARCVHKVLNMIPHAPLRSKFRFQTPVLVSDKHGRTLARSRMRPSGHFRAQMHRSGLSSCLRSASLVLVPDSNSPSKTPVTPQQHLCNAQA